MTLPIMEIISSSIKTVVTMFDTFYKNGWFLYLVVGLIAFALYIMLWN